MAQHGSKAGLLYNGYDLSPFLMQVASGVQIDVPESTCFGPLGTPVTAKSYVAGLEEGTLDCNGIFDVDNATGQPNQDRIDDVLSAALRKKQPLTYLPFGDGFGNDCGGQNGNETKYEISSPVADLVKVNMSFQSCSGVEPLSVLHVLQQEASPGGPGTDLDAGAGYSAALYKGAVAYLHVTQLSIGAGDTLGPVKVQHSSDGVTWVDLITFTNVVAPTKHNAQRVAVLGTVNRHLRANWTLSAGATATFHLACGRIPA